MSDFETIARPYSRAIFELASEQQDLQYWSDLLQVASAIATDSELQSLAESPSIAEAELTELFVSVMASVDATIKITDQARNMIALLVENGRLLAIPEIAAGYETYKKDAEGLVEVHVVSARKLTAKQEKEILNSMKARLGKEVAITSEIDQSLIAGAIIRAGDLVIDGSARGKLDKLTTLLNK